MPGEYQALGKVRQDSNMHTFPPDNDMQYEYLYMVRFRLYR